MTEDIKTEKLTQFVADTDMFEAVKEELLKGIYSNGVIKEGEKHNPLKNWALSLVFNQPVGVSNEAIGAKLVALGEGLQFVESALNSIEENYKPTVPSEDKVETNPAR